MPIIIVLSYFKYLKAKSTNLSSSLMKASFINFVLESLTKIMIEIWYKKPHSVFESGNIL